MMGTGWVVKSKTCIQNYYEIKGKNITRGGNKRKTIDTIEQINIRKIIIKKRKRRKHTLT